MSKQKVKQNDQHVSASWRSRIIGHGEEAPDQLLANPLNWRIHPKDQQDALSKVLDIVGWVQQVIVNQRTGFVVDGHLRVALAISRNETSIPVVYVDLTEEEEQLVLAALDSTSHMAGVDKNILASLLNKNEIDFPDMSGLLEQIANEFDIPIKQESPDASDGHNDDSRKPYVTCPACGAQFIK